MTTVRVGEIDCYNGAMRVIAVTSLQESRAAPATSIRQAPVRLADLVVDIVCTLTTITLWAGSSSPSW